MLFAVKEAEVTKEKIVYGNKLRYNIRNNERKG